MGITYDDLKICAGLAREARHLQELLDWWRGMASMPTPVTRDVPVRSGVTADRMGNWMDKLFEASDRLNDTIVAYVDHLLEVELAIMEVRDSDQRTILRMRYMEGLIWDKISDETHYSERWCKELHQRALKELGLYEQECMEMHGTVV